MNRLVLIAFLLAVCVLFWQFVGSLCWKDETPLGGLPCVIRAHHEYESYSTLSHSGLCGLTIRYVEEEDPPLLTFSVATVPQGDHLVSGGFTMGETEASTRFRPLWVPLQSPIRIGMALREGERDLLLDCREVQRGGRIRERVVIQTHHRYGRTLRENLANWLAARVAPFALPGIGGVLPLLVLITPIGGGVALLVVLCCCHDVFGGRPSPREETSGR